MIPYGENSVRDGGWVKNKMDNIGSDIIFLAKDRQFQDV